MDPAPDLETAPLRPVLVTSSVCAGIAALYALPPLPENVFVTIVIRVAPMVAAVNWMVADARARKIGLVHDLGFFLLIAWPIVIPWYAVKTRGRHAWPMALVLLFVIASPILVTVVVSLVRLVVARRP